MYKEICTLHPSNFYFEKDMLRTDKSLVRTRRNITSYIRKISICIIIVYVQESKAATMNIQKRQINITLNGISKPILLLYSFYTLYIY